VYLDVYLVLNLVAVVVVVMDGEALPEGVVRDHDSDYD
jgi:hypothetical protein